MKRIEQICGEISTCFICVRLLDKSPVMIFSFSACCRHLHVGFQAEMGRSVLKMSRL